MLATEPAIVKAEAWSKLMASCCHASLEEVSSRHTWLNCSCLAFFLSSAASIGVSHSASEIILAKKVERPLSVPHGLLCRVVLGISAVLIQTWLAIVLRLSTVPLLLAPACSDRCLELPLLYQGSWPLSRPLLINHRMAWHLDWICQGAWLLWIPQSSVFLLFSGRSRACLTSISTFTGS